jgi:hypothetical protein
LCSCLQNPHFSVRYLLLARRSGWNYFELSEIFS